MYVRFLAWHQGLGGLEIKRNSIREKYWVLVWGLSCSSWGLPAKTEVSCSFFFSGGVGGCLILTFRTCLPVGSGKVRPPSLLLMGHHFGTPTLTYEAKNMNKNIAEKWVDIPFLQSILRPFFDQVFVHISALHVGAGGRSWQILGQRKNR